MNLFSMPQLRRLARGIRRRLFPKQKKARPRIIAPGLPEGVDYDLLAQVVHQHFHARIEATSHEHLSGWKTSGAYRIIISLPGGKKVPLIYKVASYTIEDIPALEGLPMRPGPAEYAIYSQEQGPLVPYLPKVYWAEEVSPDECYRYILEDLDVNYQRAVGNRAVARAARMLPGLHSALREWARNSDVSRLMQYGPVYSLALQEYARPRIERFFNHAPDPLVKQVLDQWQAITSLHLRPEFQSLRADKLIHGDSNYSNVHLHKHNPSRMKLVDWEWAGFGYPQSDLASLLKGADILLERSVVPDFYREINQVMPLRNFDLRQTWRFYHWAQMERGLLDAAFLSTQYLDSKTQGKLSLPNAVQSAAQRLLTALQQLSV